MPTQRRYESQTPKTIEVLIISRLIFYNTMESHWFRLWQPLLELSISSAEL